MICATNDVVLATNCVDLATNDSKNKIFAKNVGQASKGELTHIVSIVSTPQTKVGQGRDKVETKVGQI
jgi:hypothetical protein